MGNIELNTKNKWIKLDNPIPNIPFGGGIAQINSHEIVVAATTSKPDYKNTQQSCILFQFYVFNMDTKKWKIWMEYGTEDPHTMWRSNFLYPLMFDSTRNKLYAIWRDKWIMLKIDMTTKQVTCMNEVEGYTNHIHGGYEGGFNDMNVIDFISFNMNKHWQFDKNTEKYKEIQKLPMTGWQRTFRAYTTIHMPSKRKLLIFGGEIPEGAECEEENLEQRVYEYSFDTLILSKREDIKFKIKYTSSTVLLTNDEKHALIIPGRGEYNSAILILDILDNGHYKLRWQKINIPKDEIDGSCRMQFLLTQNRKIDMIVVYGYIKYEFLKHKLRSPSNDIMHLIAMFYEGNSMMLHLFRSYRIIDNQYKNYHYTMDIGFLY